MVDGVYAVGVAVDELESAGDRYARLLGVAPRSLAAEPGVPERLMFRVANARLMLIETGGAPALFGALAQRQGQCGIAFSAEDPALAAAAIGAAPVDPDAGWIALPDDPSRGIPIALCSASDARDETGSGDTPSVSGVALDHVVVLSDALDAAIDFYRDRLGLRLALDRSFERRGVRILFFRTGGVTVEVAGPIEAPDPPAERDRFGGLAWRVADVHATRERLAGEGFDVSEQRAGHKPGTRVFTVRDGTCGVPTLVIGPDA